MDCLESVLENGIETGYNDNWKKHTNILHTDFKEPFQVGFIRNFPVWS